MKTPHAILIGLTLIAAAIFFREPSVPPVQAGIMGEVDGFKCFGSGCYILRGDEITRIRYWSAGVNKYWGKPETTTWR